mgnify:CR=1 FL=1
MAVRLGVNPKHADQMVRGAIVLPRNSLEWRCDPASEWRHPAINRRDLHIILICQQGYQSSLAAATLQQLGLIHATDQVATGNFYVQVPIRRGENGGKTLKSGLWSPQSWRAKPIQQTGLARKCCEVFTKPRSIRPSRARGWASCWSRPARPRLPAARGTPRCALTGMR